MANKRFSTIKLLVFLFCLLVTGNASLFAQNFSQTLQWNADPNVLEYKIEIQDSTGKIIKTETTEENKINLSLTQGRYKYRITAYDLLGRESVSTNWLSFEVAVAKHPEIIHKQELEALEEDGKTLELKVDIDDVTSDTVAELVNVNTQAKIRGKLILAPAEGAAAVGLSASETYKAQKARFTDVPEGNWKLVITNPSGLSSESQAFEVKDVIKEQKIAAQKAEEERLAREKAEREEAERIAAENEAKRLAAEEAEKKRLAQIEEERRAAEEAEKKRLSEIEAERKASEEAEKERLAKIEAEQKAAEEAERQRLEEIAAEQAAEQERIEKERLALEQAQREEEERLAREEEKAQLKEEKKKKRKEAWLTYDRKFNVCAGVGLAFNLYDDGFLGTYVEQSNLNPTLNAKIGYLPFHSKNSWVRFGMEFNGMATRFSTENEFYSLDLNMLIVQENLSLRVGNKSKKVWLQINAGGGMALVQEILDYSENSENNKADKTLNFGYFTAGGGLSVIFTPSLLFRIEIGADYYNLFIPDMNMGILNPYVEIGIRF